MNKKIITSKAVVPDFQMSIKTTILQYLNIEGGIDIVSQ